MPYTSDGLPFAEGSATSQIAAESQTQNAPNARSLVLACIQAAGRHGRTDDEIEVELRYVLDPKNGASHQSVSARRNDLKRAGLICRSGVKRLTRRGRPADVWVVKEVGQVVQLPVDDKPPALDFKVSKSQQKTFNTWWAQHRSTCVVTATTHLQPHFAVTFSARLTSDGPPLPAVVVCHACRQQLIL